MCVLQLSNLHRESLVLVLQLNQSLELAGMTRRGLVFGSWDAGRLALREEGVSFGGEGVKGILENVPLRG